MSRLRTTGLTIDDPLAPVATKTAGTRATSAGADPRTDSSVSPSEASVAIATAISADADTVGNEAVSLPDTSPKPTVAAFADCAPEGSPRRRPGRTVASQQPAAGVWRSWSGRTRVASYRLPDELLAELASTSADLQLQVGLIVTAAITHLLDQPGDVIASLVDRADDARIQGRRAARRGLAASSRSASSSEVGATL